MPIANELHNRITGLDAYHPPMWMQSTDPAADPANDVQPLCHWIDTTAGTSLFTGWIWKRRNSGNTAWDTILDLGVDTDVTLAANSDSKLATQKAIKAAIAAAVAGLSWKQSVRVATTAAITLASGAENGDTIDGVTLVTGDRILIKNQASASENGIYIVAASGAPTRATDADSASDIRQASVYVEEGTTNGDTQWVLTTNAPITLGSTSLSFAQLTSGGGAILASLIDAKGDLIVGSADNTAARLAVGTNAYKLVADSGQTVGVKWTPDIEVLVVPIGDETTAITTGAAKVTFRMPFACSMVAIPEAELNTSSSSGNPAFDINKNGASIFSTTLTVDSGEEVSTTAATPAVLASSPTTFAKGDKVTIDIDAAGTGAKGAKIHFFLILT
jgi:hypothetical protein